jgi:peptide/nickel transport system permease protein
MVGYLVRRLIYALISVVAVSVAVFVITRIIGDPVKLMLPLEATQAERAEMREQLGLNEPILLQLGQFSLAALRGDFGNSLWQRVPALPLVIERLPATFMLAITAMVIAIVFAVPLGVVAALRPRSFLDHACTLGSLVGMCVASNWLGLMLILVFAVGLGWLPTSGYKDDSWWRYLVLPAVTLAAAPLGRITQIVRSSTLDELNKNYVVAARSRGLTERAVILGHALKNAAIPIVTLSGWELSRLLAGFTVIVEVVFAWPGVGLLAMDAIKRQDLPLLQADVFVVGVLVVALNLLIDMTYTNICMRAQQVIYTWDYHHGQATRVIAGGLPPLRGSTMAAKQAYFAQHCDHIRTSLMQEPRGHRNMLGAVITDPVTPDGDAGLLFLHPRGFFEMCGDSTFSGSAALIDSGIIACPDPNGQRLIKLDTVAGRVEVSVQLQAGEPIAITFNNVASYSLGEHRLHLDGLGEVPASLGYGGLTYAYVEAKHLGIDSLQLVDRDQLLEMGTRVWQAARQQLSLPSYTGPDRIGDLRPVDLITVWEPLNEERGARVANFYAPQTTGRTPSGTGLSARVAVEVAAGRLALGESFVHESLLGLRFTARAVQADVQRAGQGPLGVIPAVTARSFLMGTAQWVLHPEDPFRAGFIF